VIVRCWRVCVLVGVSICWCWSGLRLFVSFRMVCVCCLFRLMFWFSVGMFSMLCLLCLVRLVVLVRVVIMLFCVRC